MEFMPLTELPWEKMEATEEGIMDTIFREPNATIRYGVLQLYLREIPVDQIERVFDLAIELEDSETPDALVESMLRVWAEREPFRCWERLKKLFLVVGLEDGWLMFDDWDVKRSSMLVQDRASIQASPFRLRRWALTGFPVGVDNSKLAPKERVSLLKEFIQRWFAVFDDYPSHATSTSPPSGYRFAEAFKMETKDVEWHCEHDYHAGYDSAPASVALRRWLVAEPANARRIIEVSTKLGHPQYDSPTIQELLRLWAEVDRLGMMKWADSAEPSKLLLNVGRGLLMPGVDAALRDRWIAEENAKAEGNENYHGDLIGYWAEWDPKGALDYAVRGGDPDIITSVSRDAACGPYLDYPRAARSGFNVVRDFDPNTLPAALKEGIEEDWAMTALEGWGEHDAAAVARLGVRLLETFNYYGFADDHPRENDVIEFFAGRNNEFRDNGHIIDRTFCALRTWAATKPAEMKAWVATLKDDKMREALTWLADNPWGPGRF
jgi:hypothetical protein